MVGKWKARALRNTAGLSPMSPFHQHRKRYVRAKKKVCEDGFWACIGGALIFIPIHPLFYLHYLTQVYVGRTTRGILNLKAMTAYKNLQLFSHKCPRFQ